MAAESAGIAGLAARYASALFDLADERHALDTVARDLAALKQLLGESADLRRLLASPVVARADQARALEAVLKAAGIGDLTRQFVATVAANRRLAALRPMIDAFLDELARRRGEITAEVTSAQALSEAQLAAVTDALRRALGAKVSVRAGVDAGLIGGLVVKVGSRLIDRSLKTKLEKLQLAMKRPLGGQV
jgi:F-type H+-transporting ATPase subunit delta